MFVDVQPRRVLPSVGFGRVIWLGKLVVCFSANTGFGLKPFNALHYRSCALARRAHQELSGFSPPPHTLFQVSCTKT